LGPTTNRQDEVIPTRTWRDGRIGNTIRLVALAHFTILEYKAAERGSEPTGPTEAFETTASVGRCVANDYVELCSQSTEGGGKHRQSGADEPGRLALVPGERRTVPGSGRTAQ